MSHFGPGPARPDPNAFTKEYAEAEMAERRRDSGHSHWIEVAIGGAVALGLLSWLLWVLLFL
jgi:hypothetical protein